MLTLDKILPDDIIHKLSKTPQNPLWHGEGDVLTHTRMVCDELTRLDKFRQADDNTQTILYMAAAFHDVGKITATRMEDGKWVSRGHSNSGANLTRQLLWEKLSGTPQKQGLREAVCLLIKYHELPIYAIEKPDGVLRLQKAASNGELCPDFTIENLCILSEADVMGRSCNDSSDLLSRVRLCAELAKESECYNAPYPFPSVKTKFEYLSGKPIIPSYPVYDNTWGEVILMSGLPGTGKDTWIAENKPDLAVISLDRIRKENKLPFTGNQSKVAEIATNYAKEFLRKKQPFIWNATNINPQIRYKLINLFANYGASVRIVFLETSWEEELRRNAKRASEVPEAAISDMLKKLSIPEAWEAQYVNWICV